MLEGKLEYLEDRLVTEQENLQLIKLFSLCFPGPQNACFLSHRFWREAPAHRFIFREPDGLIRAQVAGHDKTLSSSKGELRVIGVSEVAVDPALRGKRLSQSLLLEMEAWAAGRGFSHAMLFGPPALYAPQGYQIAFNRFHYIDWDSKKPMSGPLKSAQFKALNGQPWPEWDLDLGGPTW
jgi:GNAT superfamily N-acetyltransferase